MSESEATDFWDEWEPSEEFSEAIEDAARECFRRAAEDEAPFDRLTEQADKLVREEVRGTFRTFLAGEWTDMGVGVDWLPLSTEWNPGCRDDEPLVRLTPERLGALLAEESSLVTIQAWADAIEKARAFVAETDPERE